jgi:hypothetical protein
MLFISSYLPILKILHVKSQLIPLNTCIIPALNFYVLFLVEHPISFAIFITFLFLESNSLTFITFQITPYF